MTRRSIARRSVLCPRCRTQVTPAGGELGWRLLELLAWGGLMGSIVFVGVLVPISLPFVAPVLLAGGTAVGPLHERAAAPPHCPRCRAILAAEV